MWRRWGLRHMNRGQRVVGAVATWKLLDRPSATRGSRRQLKLQWQLATKVLLWLLVNTMKPKAFTLFQPHLERNGSGDYLRSGYRRILWTPTSGHYLQFFTAAAGEHCDFSGN
uniref:Uncharacterized protein n=1 Tax=Nelumbo nucifera TaxID=4432 RepID=A0A822YQT0_NELNU|nr:TPA_asm: hypothetical protein HUJ06_005540 [Nelumbo nucifera]